MWGALYLILFEDGATRMGWLLLPRELGRCRRGHGDEGNVNGGAECFRTYNGTELVNEIFTKVVSAMSTRGQTARSTAA